MDYTTMNRQEIRDELTSAIGDAELSDDHRETLVLLLEDRDDVEPDEFWQIVENVLEGEDGSTEIQAGDRVEYAGRVGRVLQVLKVQANGVVWEDLLVIVDGEPRVWDLELVTRQTR